MKKLSVIINSWDEPSSIGKAIKCIADHLYSGIPEDFELIQISPDNETLIAGKKAADELKRIVPCIEETSKLVQEITNRNIEQNVESEQIGEAINELNAFIQNNSLSTKKLYHSSSELKENTEQLRSIIQYFN